MNGRMKLNERPRSGLHCEVGGMNYRLFECATHASDYTVRSTSVLNVDIYFFLKKKKCASLHLCAMFVLGHLEV